MTIYCIHSENSFGGHSINGYFHELDNALDYIKANLNWDNEIHEFVTNENPDYKFKCLSRNSFDWIYVYKDCLPTYNEREKRYRGTLKVPTEQELNSLLQESLLKGYIWQGVHTNKFSIELIETED